MRIALLGTRGIPANYGGFETFYENLAPRLVQRGHEVWVYNRAHVVGHKDEKTYKGVNLVKVPSIHSKHFETISHTGLSVFHTLGRRFDIVYICGVGNSSLAWIPRLRHQKVVINVDSSDWRRAKWGKFASAYLKFMERVSGKTANLVVVDNEVIGRRYKADHGMDTVFVPYGANVIRNEGREALEKFGLEARKYVLWVGRLEPETRVEELVEAFGKAAMPGLKLVIVGDAPHAAEYIAGLHAIAVPDVVFTGKQFGETYQQLSCHAFAYVQTSPTSGTSPALLDQMAFGNAVIVRGTETNREVVGEAGLAYPPDDPVDGLAAAMQSLHRDPALVERLRQAAVARVSENYSWEHITDVYEDLFAGLVQRKAKGKKG